MWLFHVHNLAVLRYILVHTRTAEHVHFVQLSYCVHMHHMHTHTHTYI